jgi:hypothetical protein
MVRHTYVNERWVYGILLYQRPPIRLGAPISVGDAWSPSVGLVVPPVSARARSGQGSTIMPTLSLKDTVLIGLIGNWLGNLPMYIPVDLSIRIPRRLELPALSAYCGVPGSHNANRNDMLLIETLRMSLQSRSATACSSVGGIE